MEQQTQASAESLRLWTLTDGNAGNVRQAVSLAHALFPDRQQAWTLSPRLPWRWLAPRSLPGEAHAFGQDFANALSAPPDLAIGCGRQAALATRMLRQRGAASVQILDPRIATSHWSLVVAPEHDGLSGNNVITLLGSLNPVDDAWLAQARAQFADFAQLPRPITAVLLGGGSAHARFDRSAFEVLAARLEVSLQRDGGSLLVTTSRRTPTEIIRPLRNRYVETPGLVWCGEQDGRNPYPGLLAWADRIVCSPDSVNMISEACATRAPVHVFDPQRVKGRPRRFLDTLLARGRIQAMDTQLQGFQVEPLRETQRVAEVVKDRLGFKH